MGGVGIEYMVFNEKGFKCVLYALDIRILR